MYETLRDSKEKYDETIIYLVQLILIFLKFPVLLFATHLHDQMYETKNRWRTFTVSECRMYTYLCLPWCIVTAEGE